MNSKINAAKLDASVVHLNVNHPTSPKLFMEFVADYPHIVYKIERPVMPEGDENWFIVRFGYSTTYGATPPTHFAKLLYAYIKDNV